MKGNWVHKLFSCDKFGWKYFCKNNVRNQRREDKHRSSRRIRHSCFDDPADEICYNMKCIHHTEPTMCACAEWCYDFVGEGAVK